MLRVVAFRLLFIGSLSGSGYEVCHHQSSSTTCLAVAAPFSAAGLRLLSQTSMKV